MILRTRNQLGLAKTVSILLVLALVLAATLWWLLRDSVGTRVTAYFDKTVGLYAGSAVRVLGVPVGEITDVRPQGTVVRVDMVIEDGRRIPADARAVVIAPSLVSDRYVQLTPAYTGGDVLASGAVIPKERTLSPVELDELYTSVEKLTTELGPNGVNADGVLSDVLDTAADNLRGNGQSLNDTVRQLANVASTLDGAKGDLFSTVDSLRKFTAVLAESDQQIHQFYGRLADVTTYLADDKDDVGLALSSLAGALTDVNSFIKENKDLIASNVDQLTGVTKALVDQRGAIAEILDITPTGSTNLINSYDAASGTIGVRANLNELTHPPILMVCQLIKQSVPKQVPRTLIDLCTRLAPVLDGVLKLPSLAEVIGSLQQGKLPPLPLPLAEVLIPQGSGRR
jgi:phospholipid/cholesterol/gamma-HCH transport system substrate-binding protein